MDEETRRAFLAARAEKMQNEGKKTGGDRIAQFARGRATQRGKQIENGRVTSDSPPAPDINICNNFHDSSKIENKIEYNIENKECMTKQPPSDHEKTNEAIDDSNHIVKNQMRKPLLKTEAQASMLGGKKECKSENQNHLSIIKEELLPFAFDEALRIYYTFIDEHNKQSSNQRFISKESISMLREIVLDICDSFDSLFKELSFSIPDPALIKAKNEAKIKEQQDNYRMQMIYKKLSLEPNFLSIDADPNLLDDLKNQNQNQNIPPNANPLSDSKSASPTPSNNIQMVEESSTDDEEKTKEAAKEPERPMARGRQAMMRGKDAMKANGKEGRGGVRRGGFGGTSLRLANSGRPVLSRDGTSVSTPDEGPCITLLRQLADTLPIVLKLTERITSELQKRDVVGSSEEKKGSRGLEFYSYTVKGPRSANEDEFVVLPHACSFLSPLSPFEYSFVGVYDGHSGKKASLYTRSQLHYNVFSHPLFSGNLHHAITEGFHRTDERFADIQQREKIVCGSTALTVWINNLTREITVANVGDCRGYLYQHDTPIELCKPHTPMREDEKERILLAGGAVACVFGTWRVNGTLAVTRSIGDFNIKHLLIPDPEIYSFRASDQGGEYLLIASDGLWDVMNFNEVAEFVKRSPSRHQTCKLLCEEALSRKSKDNVTIVIVYFDPPSEPLT